MHILFCVLKREFQIEHQKIDLKKNQISKELGNINENGRNQKVHNNSYKKNI